MMRARRGVSSVRQVSAWFIVAAGLALYGALVLVLGIARISPSLPLPWWAALFVPPILYAIAVRIIFRRVSIVRWMVATLCLSGVHVLLGVLTATAVSYVEPWPAGFDTVDAFLPLTVLGSFCVPLFLVPFRDVIRGHVPVPPGRRPASRRVDGVRRDGAPTPLSPGQHAASAMARPGMPSHPRTPWLAPSADRPVPERPGARQTAAVPRPSPGQRGPVERSTVPKKATNGNAPADDAAGPAPRRAEEAHEASPVLVRVSFDRVAGQLPLAAFHVPLDRIGPRLLEPGHLLIPQRLVLAQLPEGFVRAGWEVVAEQFPRALLSMTDEEITLRLADGQLVLPLDELVPQLPRDLFTLSGRAVDVEGIESVPPPFQPVPAEPGEAGRTEGHAPDVPPHAVTKSLGSKAALAFADEPSAEEPPAEVAVLEDVELDPVLVGAVDGQPSSLPVIDAGGRQPGSEFAEDFGDRLGPVWEGGAAGPPTPDAVQRVRGMREHDVAATMDRVAAALAPLSPLGIGVESAEGVMLFTASGPDQGRAPGAARILLPLLAEGCAPWPVNQLTMRGVDTVLILTPLCPTGGGAAVLVSAVPPGGVVAAVERLSLRAMAAGASDSMESPRSDPDQTGECQEEPDLVESEPPTRVRQMAGSLSALGSVTASMLRDADAERDLYLFLPEGSDVRTTGRFAGELDRVVRRLAGSGYTFHTAVLRCGKRRLIIRLEHAATGPAAIVVAGGQTDRPGLAARQVEAAALLLCAR
jgi:hypothetical protein